MLTDKHPSDRVRRILDLLRSDVPEERALGLRELGELGALLSVMPEVETILLSACQHAIEQGGVLEPLTPPELPDTPWRVWHDRTGLIRAQRRLRGHILVVRQSGGREGWFYPVVDGHHPSAHGRPWTYPTIHEAWAAAEREVAAPGASRRD